MNVEFTYQFNQLGRTSEADRDAHIRHLIEQVLFTAPGERVNRPDFGCGLLNLVFEPNRSELAITTQFLVQSSLNQWLGDLIEVQDVEVNSYDSTIEIHVSYLILRNQQRQTASFTT